MSESERLNQTSARTVKLSLVICTRNRASLLNDLLESIKKQDENSQNFEVIIIDNGSTDETSKIVRPYIRDIPNLNYVLEERVGLSHARNRGWREAKGEYVAYIDDESKLPPEWMQVALELATSLRPDAFGGPIYPIYAKEKPEWFKDSYQTFDEGVNAGYLSDNQYLSGGNMIIRLELLQSSGGFVPHLGMSGKKIAYGEETYFLKRLRELNFIAVYYDKRLYVFHLVRREKMRLLYIAKSRLASGRALHRVWGGSVNESRTNIYRKLFWILRQLIKDIMQGFVSRDRQKYPSFQNYLYESGFDRLVQLGKSLEVLAEKRK